MMMTGKERNSFFIKYEVKHMLLTRKLDPQSVIYEKKRNNIFNGLFYIKLFFLSVSSFIKRVTNGDINP